MGTRFSFGLIVQATIEAQFSQSSTVGGANTWASEEEWKQQYQTEEHIELVVPPGGSVYIWQFTLSLQKSTDDVLYCHDIQITTSDDPPTNIPLPKMKIGVKTFWLLQHCTNCTNVVVDECQLFC